MTTDKYTELMDELSKQSKYLSEQTQNLNDKFTQAEKELCKLQLGVSGWAKTLVGKRPEDNTAYRFGFCRVNKDWRLVCRKIRLDIDRINDTNGYGLLEPIITMPRGIRLEASDLIDEVMEDLLKRSKDFGEDIDGAIKNIEDVNICHPGVV